MNFRLIIILFIFNLSFAYQNLTQFWRKQFNQKQPLDYQAFSGYEKVDWYFQNANIFYTYWGVRNKDMNDTSVPLIIFLQGGPGASSQFSAFNYIGPIRVIGKNQQMHVQNNPFSWNNLANLLVVDQPVNVGFSYEINNYIMNTTQEAGLHFINFLYNFFKTWGGKQREIYITGQSYAGHYVPVYSQFILSNRTLGFNLKGISIGGAYINSYIQDNYFDSQLYDFGIIDKNVSDFCRYYQVQSMINIRNNRLAEANGYLDYISNNQEVFQQYYNGINIFNLKQYDQGNCNYDYDVYMEKIKLNLGVPEHVKFVDQNDQIYAAFAADLAQSKQRSIIYCLDRIKVMIYNGQNDAVVSPAGIMTFLNSWNWRYKQNWKKVNKEMLRYGNNIYGWKKKFGRFTYALVNNAGHFVPADQPYGFFTLFSEWLKS